LEKQYVRYTIVKQSFSYSRISYTSGEDSPSRVHELTAESLRMGFLSNSSHTSLTSVASALETMARKQ